MAIYNNREVSILGPNSMANSPESINIQHTNGSHENVAVSSVYFTQAEKDALVKAHPSKFDDVKVAKPEDIDAVRVGAAPSYDPSYIEAAKAKKLAEAQAEITKKNRQDAEAKADKALKDESKPAPVTPTQVEK